MWQKSVRGFTLLELMVVVVIVIILAVVALPSFESSLRLNRVNTLTNVLIASLSLARSEAIRSHYPMGVCASSDGQSCGTNWSDGWIVWRDSNGNSALDSGEDILNYNKANPAVTIKANPAEVKFMFDRRGRTSGTRVAEGLALNQSIQLQPNQCTPQEMLQRTLRVNASGQINSASGACT